MKISKSESAVSPVIGTILLVAIAVVLVAIILTVVMGLSGDTNEKKVGMNAKSASGNDATLILYGGASIPELVRLEMIDQGSSYGTYVKLWDINENETAFVGIPYLANNVAQPEKTLDVYDTKINVRGTFSDGSEVILLVQPMTFYDVTSSKKINAEVREPIIGNKIGDDERNKHVYLPYNASQLTTAPTSVILHYQPKNDPSKLVSIDMGPGKIAATSAYTDKMVLEPGATGTTYEVWGELVTSEGNVTGPKKEYTISSLILYIWANDRSENSYTKTLAIEYRHSSLPVTEVFICYQPENAVGDQDLVRIDLTPSNFYSWKSPDQIVTLPNPNMYYNVWGGVVVEGVTHYTTNKTTYWLSTDI